MRLFLLPTEFDGSDTFKLTGSEYNYIVRVLRLKEGSSITARDKDANVWNLTIMSIDKNSCTLSAVRDSFAKQTTDALPQDRPDAQIVLYQCLPKGKKADEIVKRATEIGVLSIVFVKSKNCIADIENKENQRLERYMGLIKEAIQQSGSLIPTKVEGVLDIKDVAKDLKSKAQNQHSLGIILHQCSIKEDQKDIVKLLTGFKGIVGILVGPEGGFTDSECQMLTESGFNPVLLKSNILRCETAAIYSCAVAQTLLQS